MMMLSFNIHKGSHTYFKLDAVCLRYKEKQWLSVDRLKHLTGSFCRPFIEELFNALHSSVM